MDQAIVTAAIKKLAAGKLVSIHADKSDGRLRRVELTGKGQAVLARALPLWRNEHAAIDAELPEDTASQLRQSLKAFSEESQRR